MEMENEIKNLINNNKIFASLDEDAKNQLIPKLNKVELLHDEILYYQGDPSDSLYILVSGKLCAELITVKGETNVIGHINPGEPVGEVSVLSNEPRSLTIKALKNSLLLRLSAKIFIELCHKYPGVLIASIQPVLSRSSKIIHKHSSEKRNKHIVIIPANSEIYLDKFYEQFSKLVSDHTNILTLCDYQTEFADKTLHATEVKQLISQLAGDKKPSHRIIYILHSHDTPLARIGLKKADMIYIVAYGNSKPKIDSHILDKIHSHGFHLHNNPDLVLLHSDDTQQPEDTAAWLSLTPISLNHHIRIGYINDWQRLLRFIRGKAHGLVLSGGGTRGWAHLGAIKALQDANIPIDIVGGTSVGALVGACYALSNNYKETYDKFHKIVTQSNRSVSWRNLTWPIISLFNAKNFTLSQQEVFKNIKIEDMWLPYFCISSNLATSHEEVHRGGILWKKTRASSALPGIIPPMILDNQLHMDGGLLNNFPVDIMRQLIGIKGKIVAVDLNSDALENRKYQFPPILTFTEAFLAKFTITGQEYKFPRFADTFMRAMFIGSLSKAKKNSFSANIYINLNLNKFRMLYSDPKQIDKLLEIGYQETASKCLYDANKKN